MSKIITVTLNPSLDRTMVVHYLNSGYSNRTTEHTRLDPAGRGVNVSRALSRLGVPTNAVILLGDDAVSLSYRALVEAENLPFTPIVRTGRTRSNVIIVDTGNKNETHLIEESTVGDEDDVVAILDTLQTLTEPGDFVIFAGDLTIDGARDTYARLLTRVRDLGAHATMYTSVEPLKLALSAKPDRIITRQRELEALMNYPVRTMADCIHASRSLIERGAQEVLVMTLRDPLESEALLVDASSVIHLTAPKGEQGTTSGVEDALVAGFLSGIHHGRTREDALHLALAAAGYTAERVGNHFGTLAEIEALLETVAAVG